ncbi:hypothetical protein KIS1582_2025 [Cytobacillus firmus]|uniref:Uncharacterized protein n=1 Tax=Cytobacillus firmus TaxID=1399 RepID=A0A800NAM6_CYTFI|nr:hypothetical protein KIS1582_2025 [Cytobacillus firmus]
MSGKCQREFFEKKWLTSFISHIPLLRYGKKIDEEELKSYGIS